jgi:creatinine amidohydrolase
MLDEMTWTAAARAGGSVLVVPLGTTEQHGPHLALGTDTFVARALCGVLARRRADVAVAPAMPYGSSGEHADFPGTLSIGQPALEAFVVELVRSADHFAGVVLVSGHGGNAEPLTRAVATSIRDGRRVLTWWPSTDALRHLFDPEVLLTDAHAGRVETSIMLHLAPDLVRDTPAPSGSSPRPLPEIAAALRAPGVRAVSPTGVLGDPAGASADEGAAILEAYMADLQGRIDSWRQGWS